MRLASHSRLGRNLCILSCLKTSHGLRRWIVSTEQIVPPPALVRAGLETLPTIIRAQGERARHRFIEFFTATIRNRNTRMAHARAVVLWILAVIIRCTMHVIFSTPAVLRLL
jgi:hypothetical protein